MRFSRARTNPAASSYSTITAGLTVYYEPFDYLDEVPCGQPAAETAFKLGVCKACPRNQICAFMVQEMYHDVVYDCTGKEISRYNIGD